MSGERTVGDGLVPSRLNERTVGDGLVPSHLNAAEWFPGTGASKGRREGACP